ncbi:helix-turn-helix domain-containing protein [Nocardia abscessus]|uniref:helix-turn-helix domain-containing protein n=1 Tax=Nocardia abscessus TaxID=120957 RepID=UPI001E39C076|nr:helix-turn-helix domain-containing protein [Nocardia abscessus]
MGAATARLAAVPGRPGRAHARTSVRTLTRRFHEETGLSPQKWLLHQRLHRARELLESTTLPMEQVARYSGIGSAESLRQHMIRHVGVSPSSYRASFTRSPVPIASADR